MRLSKIAKDYQISIGTLVKVLQEKCDPNMEWKPMSSVPDHLIELLNKEFNSNIPLTEPLRIVEVNKDVENKDMEKKIDVNIDEEKKDEEKIDEEKIEEIQFIETRKGVYRIKQSDVPPIKVLGTIKLEDQPSKIKVLNWQNGKPILDAENSIPSSSKETPEYSYDKWREYMTKEEWESFIYNNDKVKEELEKSLYEDIENEKTKEEEYEEIPECPDYLPFTNGLLTCPRCGRIGTTYIDGTAYCRLCREWYRYA